MSSNPIAQVKDANHDSNTCKESDDEKVFVLLFLLAQSATAACVGIGYSNRGGWFFWPDGLGLAMLILIVVLLLRRK